MLQTTASLSNNSSSSTTIPGATGTSTGQFIALFQSINQSFIHSHHFDGEVGWGTVELWWVA